MPAQPNNKLRSTNTNRLIVAACIVLTGIAVWIGTRMADSPSSLQISRTSPNAVAMGGLPAPLVAGVNAGSSPTPDVRTAEKADPSPGLTGASPVPEAAPSAPPTGAEMVERWLSTTDAAAGAVNVLQHWSSLKPEEQLPALGRVLNMVPDDRYNALERVLADPATTPEAADVIFRDAVNRPSNVKLHAMLSLIAQPRHPFASKAREALVNDLGIDDGANQGAWIAHVQEYLHSQAQQTN